MIHLCGKEDTLTEKNNTAQAVPAVPSFAPGPDLLTPTEVAAMTGHTLNTLAQYRSRRLKGRDALGPDFVKVGREPYYPRAAVEAYLTLRG